MLAELRKHAQTGERLRKLVLEKDAGIVGKAAKRVATSAAVHPIRTVTMGLGTVAGAGAAGKTYHSFNPAVQRAQLGMG